MQRSFLSLLAVVFWMGSVGRAQPAEWVERFPREEIAPRFSQTASGDLTLAAKVSGTNGHFLKVFPIEGGKSYAFSAERLAQGIEHERRSCVVRIEWYGPGGRNVQSPHPVNPAYFGKATDAARPDFPRDGETLEDGAVRVRDTYRAPAEATEAHVQLHLRWTEAGRVTWRKVSFAECEPLPPRLVTLAAVHHDLSGVGENTVANNRTALAPLVEKAADQGADLIVLGEFITCKNVTSDYASVAELIPGPTSDFFGDLTQRLDCHLVFTIPERAGHEIFNTSVLMGPEGELVGTYRKVTLPREEIQKGLSPGSDYPVFDTRFGKVGMMVCYDVFFPEVARELSQRGAEVIAMPIWGGNPRLAAARCAENGVFLVTSTYTHHDSNWMKTAIWDREGNRITEAKEWGSVVMAEVDLNEPTHWAHLGDFRSRIPREAPIRRGE